MRRGLRAHQLLPRLFTPSGQVPGRRGQADAGLLGFGFLVASVVLMVTGHSLLGGVLGLAGIVAPLTVALLRRRDERHSHG